MTIKQSITRHRLDTAQSMLIASDLPVASLPSTAASARCPVSTRPSINASRKARRLSGNPSAAWPHPPDLTIPEAFRCRSPIDFRQSVSRCGRQIATRFDTVQHHGQTSPHCLHRRRLHRVHEEHRRRHPAAPGNQRRHHRADGYRYQRLAESEIVAAQTVRTLGVKRPCRNLTPTSGRALDKARLRHRRLPDRRLSALHRSPISKCRRSMACARPLPTRWASAASCAACAPSRTCGRFAKT